MMRGCLPGTKCAHGDSLVPLPYGNPCTQRIVPEAKPVVQWLPRVGGSAPFGRAAAAIGNSGVGVCLRGVPVAGSQIGWGRN